MNQHRGHFLWYLAKYKHIKAKRSCYLPLIEMLHSMAYPTNIARTARVQLNYMTQNTAEFYSFGKYHGILNLNVIYFN